MTGEGLGRYGATIELQSLLSYRAALALLKKALFILKVEKKTAEAAETDAEGTLYSTIKAN